MPDTNETPTWVGLFGAAPGIDLTGEARSIARMRAEALRDAADELARLGHRSAVTRLREMADRHDEGAA